MDHTQMDRLQRFKDGLLFGSALQAMEKIHAMVKMGNFTQDTFANVEILEEGISIQEVCRAGIGMNVVAISENLWGIKNRENWYNTVPEDTFEKAKKMRNLVSHHYGHGQKVVDWDDLWKYIEIERDSFVNQLRWAVERAKA